MTAPYDPKVAELITSSLRHESRCTLVTAAGERIPVDVAAGSASVTFDESWAPYAQARLDAAIPGQPTLDKIDPRRNCRLELEAGYTYPDNHTELHMLADLGLRERPVRRPANTLSLIAGSDEARAQDRRILWSGAVPKTGINEAIGWLADFALEPENPVLVSDYAAGSFAADLTELTLAIGDELWPAIDDAAARTGTRVYCDELRTWRVTKRQETLPAGTVPVHRLAVGEAGTIITTDTSLTRDEWFNACVLVHRWRDAAGVEKIINGVARVSTGEWATGTVGFKVYREDSDRPITKTQADKKAASRLRNLVTRGRSMRLSAIAAYWIRPGDPVEVALVTGEAETHFVRSVTFDLNTGRMDLVTRQPTNITIATGE